MLCVLFGTLQISIHAPLAGCDLLRIVNRCFSVSFQSTHPLRGATNINLEFPQMGKISIHAPLAGCDPGKIYIAQDTNISIHAPLAGCDMAENYQITQLTDFNPRTPCGVRQRLSKTRPRFGHFNPRTPCGVRLYASFFLNSTYSFQSTHPLRGATGLCDVVGKILAISIHAPLAGCDVMS